MAEKKQTVILTTSDDEQFTVEKIVAERSAMIKSMMEGEWLFGFRCLFEAGGVTSRCGDRVVKLSCHVESPGSWIVEQNDHLYVIRRYQPAIFPHPIFPPPRLQATLS